MDLMKYVKFLATIRIPALACSVPTVGPAVFPSHAYRCLHLYDRMQRSTFSYMIYQFISKILPLGTVPCRYHESNLLST